MIGAWFFDVLGFDCISASLNLKQTHEGLVYWKIVMALLNCVFEFLVKDF